MEAAADAKGEIINKQWLDDSTPAKTFLKWLKAQGKAWNEGRRKLLFFSKQQEKKVRGRRMRNTEATKEAFPFPLWVPPASISGPSTPSLWRFRWRRGRLSEPLPQRC